MKRIRILVAIVCLAGLTTACEFFDSLTKTTQAVSILTRTPDLAQAIPDTNLRNALNTGGVMGEVDTGATAVVVGVGQRPEAWSIEAPTPVEGASLLLTWGGNQVEICATGGEAGTYSASSIAADPCGDTTLAYVGAETYTTEIRFDDVDGTLEVVAPTAINIDVDDVFEPDLIAATDHYGATLPSHSGGALTVDWSTDNAASARPAILTVFHIRFTGSSATDALVATSWSVGNNPVHTDAPDTPEEMIKMILLGEYPTSAVIPASVFATRGLYFVVLTSMELSETKSDLSLGSGALAGLGTTWAFWVD